MPEIAIIGASKDRSKFGNKAVRAYLKRGWTVHPIHPTEREIEGLEARSSIAGLAGPIDRVALYVPPSVGLTLLDEIAAAKPAQVYANPGADSPELLARARELGIPIVAACAIVAIGESPSDYP